MAEPSVAPGARLMLIWSLGAPREAAGADACLSAGDVAAVILRPGTLAGDALRERLEAVVPAIQAHGAAALLDGSADAVSASGLDGAHVRAATDALKATLGALKPQFIVGTGPLPGRHEAMEAGEAGVDYVLFGPLDPAPEDFPRTVSLAFWWAELFEVPCVAVASTLDEVEALALARADFVALAEPLASDPARIAEAQARMEAALDTAEMTGDGAGQPS